MTSHVSFREAPQRDICVQAEYFANVREDDSDGRALTICQLVEMLR